MKKHIKLKNIIILLSVLLLNSCDLDEIPPLNGLSADAISSDLSRAELPQVLSGVFSDMRVGLATQVDVQSIFGREYYFFTGSDPRFEADVVTGNLDNNTFYTTTPWNARYANIRNINLALEGLANTTVPDFSAEEIAATTGVLNTLLAHELLMLTNNQFNNGIRLDVADASNLGAFVNETEALTAIFNLLEQAASDLRIADVLELSTRENLFVLPGGFDDLEDPTALAVRAIDFLEFNRALTARVEAYRGNYPNVLMLLQESFMNMTGDLTDGIYHTFSLSGGDIANPLFIALNQASPVRVAHSSFIADALPNDSRFNKVVFREALNEDTDMIEPNPVSFSDLTGTHDVFIYQNNVTDVPIIRNEELILLFAEANIVASPGDAVNAINIIRNAAGIGDYTGGISPIELEDEILFQRRYSLFGESHRWVDMRRFGRLDELQLLNDRPTDNVPMAVPIPFNENQ